MTPLCYAAAHEKNYSISILINHGAYFRDGINGESFIHWAVSKNFFGVVVSLINNGANINEKDNNLSCRLITKRPYIAH